MKFIIFSILLHFITACKYWQSAPLSVLVVGVISILTFFNCIFLLLLCLCILYVQPNARSNNLYLVRLCNKVLKDIDFHPVKFKNFFRYRSALGTFASQMV